MRRRFEAYAPLSSFWPGLSRRRRPARVAAWAPGRSPFSCPGSITELGAATCGPFLASCSWRRRFVDSPAPRFPMGTPVRRAAGPVSAATSARPARRSQPAPARRRRSYVAGDRLPTHGRNGCAQGCSTGEKAGRALSLRPGRSLPPALAGAPEPVFHPRKPVFHRLEHKKQNPLSKQRRRSRDSQEIKMTGCPGRPIGNRACAAGCGVGVLAIAVGPEASTSRAALHRPSC